MPQSPRPPDKMGFAIQTEIRELHEVNAKVPESGFTTEGPDDSTPAEPAQDQAIHLMNRVKRHLPCHVAPPFDVQFGMHPPITTLG